MKAISPDTGEISKGAFAHHWALSRVIPPRRFFREPRFFVATLWPLVLLAPHVPGLPRPALNGLPWRQELALSFLLCLTLGFLIKRGWTESQIRIDRHRLLVLCGAGLFAMWAWLSVSWAAFAYPAIHLALQWTAYVVFFLLISSAAGHPRIVRSSFVVLAGVVWILAIACAIESWFGAPLTDGNLRNDLKPILRGSGAFGEIMAMAAILFAALTLHVRRPRQAILCGVTATLAWLATLQSFQRAPLVGAFAGLLFVISGSAIGSFGNRRRVCRLLLLIGALASVLSLQIMPSFGAREDSSVARLQPDMRADPSGRVRLLFWGVGLEMVRAHPLLGVGGNNYEVNYPAARAQFAAKHPTSSLVSLNEHLLTIYAHSEYVQILAELGIIGFFLFLLLLLAIAASFMRAMKHKHQTLPALGAGGAMLAFAISSSASGSSFRYCGGALLFFFSAAIVTRIAANTEVSSTLKSTKPFYLSGPIRNVATLSLCTLMLLTVCVLSVQATGIILHGLAQGSTEPSQAERYYQASLRLFPASTATNFGYGTWLYRHGRAAEGIPHLRFAVDRGFNSSTCYAYLAGAEDSAGDLVAAERTAATAVKAYPNSVFLLVRHAVALERNGRSSEAEVVFSRAVSLEPRAARGWRNLIDNDIDAAYAAAKQDRNIALPGELAPEEGVFAVLQENERRFPAQAHTGWRARMRSAQPQ